MDGISNGYLVHLQPCSLRKRIQRNHLALMGKRRKKRQKLRKIKKQTFPREEIIERDNRPSDRTIPSGHRLPITIDGSSRDLLLSDKDQKNLSSWVRLVESLRASLRRQRDQRNASQTRYRDEDNLLPYLFREAHFPRPLTIEMINQ